SPNRTTGPLGPHRQTALRVITTGLFSISPSTHVYHRWVSGVAQLRSQPAVRSAARLLMSYGFTINFRLALALTALACRGTAFLPGRQCRFGGPGGFAGSGCAVGREEQIETCLLCRGQQRAVAQGLQPLDTAV